MPVRREVFVSGEIYHVCNRGIDHRATFVRIGDYRRAYQIIEYYRYASLPVRLSKYLRLSKELQGQIMGELRKSDKKIVNMYAYCLMPNHVHFLLRQLSDNGISRFMGQFFNSYTKYFNTANKKEGSLFLNQFKAVRIVTDEQFLHVSRYIHLNPFTSYVVKSIGDLFVYPWSSFREYLDESIEGICNREEVFSFFRDRKSYIDFVCDQADYQRELGRIKHLILED